MSLFVFLPEFCLFQVNLFMFLSELHNSHIMWYR